MIIALDMDDILCNTQEIFIKFYNDTYNDNLDFDDFDEYEISDIKNISKEKGAQILEEFDKSDYFNMIEPLKNSQKVVSELSENHKLIIITARTSKVEDQTKKWVKKYFPDIKKIFFVSDNYLTHTRKKSNVCKDIGADVIIEDKKKFAIDCSNNGTKVLLFDYPWNRKIKESDKIIRIKSWDDVLGKLSD